MRAMQWLAVAALAGSAVFAGEQTGGKVIFSDNFEGQAALTKNWEPGRNAKKENGIVTLKEPDGKIAMKQTMPDEFHLTAKIKLTPPSAPDGTSEGATPFDWAGFTIPGVGHFILQKRGVAQLVYKKPGDKTNSACNLKIEGFSCDKTYTLTLVREQAGQEPDHSRWTFLVDDKKVGEIVLPNPSSETRLSVWVIGKITATLDDFTMAKLKKEEKKEEENETTKK